MIKAPGTVAAHDTVLVFELAWDETACCKAVPTVCVEAHWLKGCQRRLHGRNGCGWRAGKA